MEVHAVGGRVNHLRFTLLRQRSWSSLCLLFLTLLDLYLDGFVGLGLAECIHSWRGQEGVHDARSNIIDRAYCARLRI